MSEESAAAQPTESTETSEVGSEVEDDKEYEIEDILTHRFNNDLSVRGRPKKEYLV